MSAPERPFAVVRERAASAAAERTRARAELERARAEAESIRQQSADEAERRRELAKDEKRDRHDLRKARKRAERDARWRRRVAAVTDGVADMVRALPVVAGIVACVAPTVIAFRGQYEFAHGPMQLGALAWLFPAMLEGAAWYLAWRRYRAVQSGEPLGWLTPGVWALALTAAAMNVWHGATAPGGSLQVGVGYGLASLIGFALVELVARHDRAASQHGVHRVGVLRALRFPPVAFAAWSRMVEMGPDADAREAWEQAWVDRYDVEPGATRDDRKDGRLRVLARDWGRRNSDVLADLLAELSADDTDEAGDEVDTVPVFALDPVDFDPAAEDESEQFADEDEDEDEDAEVLTFHFPDGMTVRGYGAGLDLDDDLDDRTGGQLPAGWVSSALAWLDEARPLEERVELAAAELQRRRDQAGARRQVGRRAVAKLLGRDEDDYEVRKAWDERSARQNGHTEGTHAS